MHVIPLGRTELDVKQLLVLGQNALGRSLSEELDKHNIPVDKPSSLITILAAMKKPVKHHEVQLEPGALLQHISYSFLVVSTKDTLMDMLEHFVLAIHSAKSLSGLFVSVVSGTLDKWQTSILSGCSPNSEFELRRIATECLLYLDNEGFKLFPNHQRLLDRKDSTIKLISND